MKTVVIDSLNCSSLRGNAGSSPELTAISGDDPVNANEALNMLERLLASLSMDEATLNELLDVGNAIYSRGEEYGFRRGFRVAVQLMIESIWIPEAPTLAPADRYSSLRKSEN